MLERIALHRSVLLAFVALCTAISGCHMSEASFVLAQSSRIPKWFALPAGATRKDVEVNMTYYVEDQGRIAKFTFIDLRDNKVLAQADGTLRGLEPLKVKTDQPTAKTPTYEIVSVAGVTELVEHRSMEPVFYISDDANLKREFGLGLN